MSEPNWNLGLKCTDALLHIAQVCGAPMKWRSARSGEGGGVWICTNAECGGVKVVPKTQRRLL